MCTEIIAVIEKEIGNKIIFFKEIVEGHSKDKKYYVESTLRKYFIRIIPCSANMIEKYRTLREIGVNHNELLSPEFLIIYKEYLIIGFDWIVGTPLSEEFCEYEKQAQISIARRVGKAVRKFHELTEVNSCDREFSFNEDVINDFIAKYLSNKQGDKFRETLEKFDYSNLKKSLIHCDLRPANIIVKENNEIMIIDFECMSYNLSYIDLTYCLLLSAKYQTYGQELIYGYFDGVPPKDFWDVQNSLLAIELIRYAANPRNTYEDVTQKLEHLKNYLF